jgi:TRAP-type C4-dicarboxylate transport system substrate-binding protein
MEKEGLIMKKIERHLAMLLVLAACMFVAMPATAGGDIKLALDSPPDAKLSSTYLWSITFQKHVEAKGLKAKLYPRDALGGEAEKLDQVSQGLLELSCSDLAKAGSLDSTIFGFYLPFLFDSNEHFFKTLDNTDLMDQINAGLSKHGVRVISFVPLGAMTGFATNKKMIKSPGDLEGIRMRALDKKQVKWFEVWGANAVVIPWSEIYNALQTGIADGYLNPPGVPLIFKHNEVLKYYAHAEAGLALRLVIASEDWYQGISGKERGLVDEAVSQADAAVRIWNKEAEAAHLEGLRKLGMEVYINSPAERAEFAKLIRPLYSEIVDEKIVKKFLKAAEEQR